MKNDHILTLNDKNKNYFGKSNKLGRLAEISEYQILGFDISIYISLNQNIDIDIPHGLTLNR
jgi:hypothetical protein